MIKKIFLLAVCLIILVSCGRKGDPEYKTSQHYIVLPKYNEIH